MIKSKLLKAFKKLSKEELKDFKKFVQSPYFNNSKEVVKLCEYLIKEAPDFVEKRLDRKVVYQRITRTKTYNDGKMRVLMSGLYKQIRRFLALQGFERDEAFAQLFLLREFMHRGMDDSFTTQLKSLQQLKNQMPTSEDYYLQNFYLELIHHRYLIQRGERNVEPNLQGLSQSLSTFFIANQLRYYASMLSYQQMFNIHYELSFEPALIDYLEKNWELYPPIIGTYYFCILTMLHPNEINHYQELKTLLGSAFEEMPSEMLVDVYAHTRNYCIRQIRTGNLQYLEELFDIYELMIQQNMLLQEEQIRASDYRNIVVNAIRLKKYDWAKNFITNHHDFLEPNHKHNTYHYCQALLHFELQAFSQTLDHLREINSREIFIVLNHKTLLIKSYYELEEIISLDALIKSFKEYLRNHKEIGIRQYFINFVNFVNQLQNVNYFDKGKVEKLKAKIQETPQVTEKAWLLAKVNELLK